MISPLQQRLRKAPDFASACQVMTDYFTQVARRTARECQQAGIPYDATFWPEEARRAANAGSLYAAYEARARLKCAAHLQRLEMEEYALALTSGDFAQHLDLPAVDEASGS